MNLLVGNGLIIQYGGTSYLNSEIVKRAFQLTRKEDFPEFAVPREIDGYILRLHSELKKILKGKFDEFAVLSQEPELLSEIKNKYKRKTKYFEIGIEDYLFLHQLFSRKKKINNPDRFYIQEHIRRFFLHSIYNEGKVNLVYKKFPEKICHYFYQFENIFTTNYDKNIDIFTGEKVYHIHGEFEVLDNPYNPESLRNQMIDAPLNSAPDITGYEYLFSTAMMSYSGDIKKSMATSSKTTNEAIRKMADKYDTDPKAAAAIEELKNKGDTIGQNIYDSIMKTRANKTKGYIERDSISKLSSIEGNLDIIGLSPYNDQHIFSEIRDNQGLDYIRYYFFEESEIPLVKIGLQGKEIKFQSVKEFWYELE